MDSKDIRMLFEGVKKNNEIEVAEAMRRIKDLPFKDLGFATIDNHRELRVGYPEVIYCEGKTVGQVKEIITYMLERDNNILATRANEDIYNEVKKICKEAKYNQLGRTITIQKKEKKQLLMIAISLLSVQEHQIYLLLKKQQKQLRYLAIK